jgi:uncharacterized protein with HEPN domain
LEIIGEAANRVSDDTQSRLSQLPWREMIGMRNIVIHQYDAVDLQMIWDTIQRDLPDIIQTIESVIGSER